MASLGSLVVKLVLDGVGKYKADLNDASTATGGLSGKLQAAKDVAGAAEGNLTGAARGAVSLASGAGVAAVGVGVLVAGIGAAVYAAHQGALEQKAYEKALIMTGNAAGTNASQMQAMAASIGQVVGTQHEAAAALAAMAATGKVAGADLEKFGQVAVESQRVLGTSVQDTAKQFAELGNEPVKASLKLNDTMNYLTATTFAQIKAAEDLGDKTTAGAIAQNAFADAVAINTAKIKANLGSLEKAWMSVRDFAKSAWDAMMGIGRQTGTNEALAQAEKVVANIKAKPAGDQAELADSLKMWTAKVALLKETLGMQTKVSESQAASVALEKAGITWLQEGDKYLSKKEKTEQAVARIRQEGAAAGISELEIEKRVTAEREKGATKGGSTRVRIDENEKLLASVREGLAASQAEVDMGQKLTPVQKEIATLYASISQSKKAYTLATLLEVDALMQQKLANEAANMARVAEAKATEAANKERQKTLNSLASEAGSLDEQIRKQRDHNEGIGKSKEVIAALTAQRDLDAASTLEAMAIKKLDRDLDYELYDAQMKIVQGMRERAALTTQGAGKEAEVEANRKAVEEFKSFWQSIDQTAHDVFVSIQNGSNTLWEKMKGTAKAVFFDYLYQMTLKKWLFNVTVAATGTGASIASAATGGGDGVGGLLGAAKNVSSFNTGYFTNFGATAVGDIASMGANLYSKGFETIGNSLMDIGNSLAQYSDVISTAGDVLGYAGALYSLSQGNYVQAAFTAVGTYFFGPIGGAIGSYLGSFFNKDPGSKSSGDTTASYDATGQRTGSHASFGFETATTSAGADGLQNTYASIANALGIQAVDTTFGMGGNSDGKTSHFSIGSSAGGKGYQTADNTEYSDAAVKLEASRAVFSALQGSDLPQYLAGAFDGIVAGSATQDQITAALNGAQALKGFHDQLQLLPFENLKDASYVATQAMIAASGGLENLGANLGVYLDKFYSEGEKAALGTANLAAQFAAMNETLPATYAEYRKLQESQDLNTERGRNLNAMLIALAPAFDQAASSAQAAAQRMANVISDYATSDEVRSFSVEQIRKGLADGGVNLTNDQIANASRQDARALYEQLIAQGNQQGADAVLNQAAAFAKITANTYAAQAAAGSSGSSGGSSGASAADSIKSAWESITDSIWGEVKRIRGLLEGSGADGYAIAQARFAIATAQTRAGDQDAAKALPGLSQAMLTLAENNTGTLIELQRIRAQTAASLSDTATMVSGKNGIAIPAFDSGGLHAGGLRLVGENGPEIEATGQARIYSAADTRAMLQGGNNDALVAEIRALRAEVAALKDAGRETARNTAKTASTLVRVTHDGEAMQTEAA